jgi:NADPH-dependent 2,4-dienoyl-CoA reductase/sulfur reductase-like enzyme
MQHLESNIKGVYAGGDNAYAPILNTTACIGHWQLAHYHGRIAALNMAGKQTEIQTVPFFWTMLFGKGVRFAGMILSITVSSQLKLNQIFHNDQTCRIK